MNIENVLLFLKGEWKKSFSLIFFFTNICFSFCFQNWRNEEWDWFDDRDDVAAAVAVFVLDMLMKVILVGDTTTAEWTAVRTTNLLKGQKSCHKSDKTVNFLDIFRLYFPFSLLRRLFIPPTAAVSKCFCCCSGQRHHCPFCLNVGINNNTACGVFRVCRKKEAEN